MNMLLEGSFFQNYGLLIILVVALVAMFVWNYFRQKKYQQQEEQMIQEIKIGTKVRTYAGVYGTIVGIYESTEGRVAILSLDGKATMEVDFRSIYGIDNKTKIEDVKEEPVQPEQSEPQAEEPVAEEPVKETPAKKTRKTKKAE